jgi:hypothetical protein
MVLKWLSDAILIIKNVFFFKTFDAELMLRTAAVDLSCCENNFFEIDFWLQKVEKTIPFLNSRKMMKKYFSILGCFSVRAWIKHKKNPLKRYPTWKKCFKRDCSAWNSNWLLNQKLSKDGAEHSLKINFINRWR